MALKQTYNLPLSSQEMSKQMTIRLDKQQEASVWQDFKNGDEAAFIWIYNNFFKDLYNYGHQFGMDTELVKDQIQELFIYLRDHRKQLGDVKNIKYYLYKCLRRRLLSSSKKRFSFLSLFLPEDKNKFGIECQRSAEVIMIDRQVNEETCALLAASIDKLTLRQKEAVLHFYYEGMSYQEIADIMSIRKVKSVRKLIYRAIDTLRKDLKDFKKQVYN